MIKSTKELWLIKWPMILSKNYSYIFKVTANSVGKFHLKSTQALFLVKLEDVSPNEITKVGWTIT